MGDIHRFINAENVFGCRDLIRRDAHLIRRDVLGYEIRFNLEPGIEG